MGSIIRRVRWRIGAYMGRKKGKVGEVGGKMWHIWEEKRKKWGNKERKRIICRTKKGLIKYYGKMDRINHI